MHLLPPKNRIYVHNFMAVFLQQSDNPDTHNTAIPQYIGASVFVLILKLNIYGIL